MKKNKLVLEYELRCTPISLFRAVSTSEGLCEWFADKVEISDAKYMFLWDKMPYIAYKIESKENSFIRYQWEDDTNYFFEFRINNQELTGDISLTVTDFVSDEDHDDTVALWNLQIRKLKRSIGCTKKW